MPLYNVDIYTLDDIKFYTTKDLLEIPGIGKTSIKVLLTRLNELGIVLPEFSQKAKRIVSIPTPDELVNLLKEKPQIERRIQRQNQLEARYQELLEQKEALKQQEIELDKKIAAILKDIDLEREGTSNGRK